MLSIRSLTKHGYRIAFEGDSAEVSKNGDRVFVAHCSSRLYEVEFKLDRDSFAGFSGEKIFDKSSQTAWHFRLGHSNAADMKKMVNRKMVHGVEKLIIKNDKFCEPCVIGKQTRLPFPKKNTPRSSRVLELIHSDVCGPFPVPAHDGSKYFITFTDDYSRATMVFCIQRKSESSEKFKEFMAMSEALHGCKVAKLRVDQGGEYTPEELKAYCKEKGI